MKKRFKKKEAKHETKKQDSLEKTLVLKKSNFISWAAFLFTLSVVLVSLVSVIFPALIASSNSTLIELRNLGIILVEVNPFVLGAWSILLLVSNVIVFLIAISYFKKKLSSSFRGLFEFIFTFEVSRKVAFVSIIVLLATYVAVSAGNLTTEEEWEDYPAVKQRVDNWSPEQITNSFEPHVRYFLLWSSMKLFGYYTIIPFIASISLLLLTYFFTVEVSRKRFAGIISMIILLQSKVFLSYDSTVAYTNFWILFYLLSLYLIYKVWPLSPVSYLLSVPSKAITAIFLPMSLFFIFRSRIERKKKIIVASASTALILGGAIVALSNDVNLTGATGKQEEFSSDEFWLGFTSFSYQLRFDGLVLLFILPLIVGLFIASRNGFKDADSIMVLIGGILLTAPLLTGFTELTNLPYRFVPLVVFFAIGVGVLLSKKTT